MSQSPSRSLLSAILSGFLYGAILFGGVLSVEHVIYNRLDSGRDASITLAVFFLLYGLWAGAFFGAAWVLAALGRVLRGKPLVDRWALGQPESGGEPWAPGLLLFNLVFWEVFFLYGLTYDQAPFGHPQTKWGMLAVLLVLGLLIAIGVWIAVRLQATLARRLGRSGALRKAGYTCAALLLLAHFFAPSWSGRRPEAAKTGSPPQVVRQPTGLKVVVVGLDGADWRVLRPMMERGELPAFSSTVAQGSSADLESIQDSNSAVIWASIYSGMVPERHGVYDFYRIALPGFRSAGLYPIHRTFFKELADLVSPLRLTRQIPVDRFSMSDAPYWEIADRFGVSLGLVDGYFYSFPALHPSLPESYFFSYGLNEIAERASGHIELFLQPKELFRTVRPLLEADDFVWQRGVLRERLQAAPQPELINFYTHQPDSVQHWTWKWYEPAKFFGVTASALKARGGEIEKQQRDFDAFLAELEAKVGPETVILIASDHGHSPTIVHTHYSQHRHGPPGILLLRGGPVRAGTKLEHASVYDVYPTVLYLLGLPVPQDAAGKVLTEALDPAFVRDHPIRTLPSYRPFGASPGLPGAARDGAMNQMEIEKLRSLGYML